MFLPCDVIRKMKPRRIKQAEGMRDANKIPLRFRLTQKECPSARHPIITVLVSPWDKEPFCIVGNVN